jgi:hypothetical protein
MIADPNEGQRCSRCWHLPECPTPQACEQAEEDRLDRAWKRDLILALAAIAAVGGTLLIINWRAP